MPMKGVEKFTRTWIKYLVDEEHLLPIHISFEDQPFYAFKAAKASLPC